jgi:CRP-like cAMP-binding protein
MAAALATTLRQKSEDTHSASSIIAERIALISASALFTGLPQHAYEKLASQARPKGLARNELLFMQGGAAHKVALIRSGSIKITQLAPNGNEVILWIYGVRNIAGVISDPTSCCYSYSARALEASTALVWECTAIQELMSDYPQIRKNASNILAARLNELEERFREVATEKIAKRMSSALIRLQAEIGKKAHGGTHVSLLREELAQLTGTTLFTVSRILSQWGKLGFVMPRREGVLVRDTRRLELAGEDDLGRNPFFAKA